VKPQPFLFGFLLSLTVSFVGLSQGSLETITTPEGKEVGSIDWSAAGKIEATGFGIGAANAGTEAQKKVTARRAAMADAQRQLVEIVQGVSVYNGVLTSDRMLANDTVVTQVQGVLRGAVIVPESEKWDAEAGLYELTMTIALGDLRDAVEPTDMEASLDIENLILLGSSVTQTPTEPSEPAEASTPDTPDPNQTPAVPTPSLAATNDSFEVARGGTLSQTVLSNDTNLGPNVQVTMLGNVGHGTLTLNPDGTFTYTHDGSASATDVFKYSVSDGTTTAEAFVTLSVALAPGAETATTPATAEQPQNPNVPVAGADNYTVNPGETLEIAAANGVLANDSSPTGGPLLVISNGSPSHGTLTLYPQDGSFRYIPDGSGSSDSFVYTVNDGTANSNETTVTITVTPGIQTQGPQTQETQTQATQAPAIPQTSTQEAVVQGGTAVSAPASPSASPSTPSSPTGGGEGEVIVPQPVEVATGELPTGIILDASASEVKRALFVDIFNSKGEVLAEKVKASYVGTSLDEAKQHPDVASSPEILPVFALSSNNINLVLSDEASGRFQSLMAAKNFNIVIMRQ
jgi:VCBS repeat-containing protein